jgi:hypothetical protein
MLSYVDKTWILGMASLTVRQLDDKLKKHLRLRADEVIE